MDRSISYIRLSWGMTTMGILSAMEYRISFLMQIAGMIINNIAFILLWIIFFAKFPILNGWTFQDTALLFAVVGLNYSLVMIFANGSMRLARTITSGELDYYLSYPKNPLWFVSVSKTDVSAIGDLIFAIAIFFLSGNITTEKIFLTATMSVITALIFYNFIVITQSLSFYFGNFEDAAEHMVNALMGFTLYPQTVFGGAIKVVMFTILPAFFIATLPVEIVKHFNIYSFLTLILFWLVTFCAAILIFKQGLKRYESGNLLNMKL